MIWIERLFINETELIGFKINNEEEKGFSISVLYFGGEHKINQFYDTIEEAKEIVEDIYKQIEIQQEHSDKITFSESGIIFKI